MRLKEGRARRLTEPLLNHLIFTSMNLLTKEFETSKCRLLAVNLPDGVEADIYCGRCYKPNNNEEVCWSAKDCSRNTDFPDILCIDTSKSWAVNNNYITLPPGEWEILNVTEEKAREVVDEPSIGMYVDYSTKVDFGKKRKFDNALESFESLIKSEIKTVNKYGEKMPSILTHSYLSEDDIIKLQEEWEAEQATVFDNYIILISKK